MKSLWMWIIFAGRPLQPSTFIGLTHIIGQGKVYLVYPERGGMKKNISKANQTVESGKSKLPTNPSMHNFSDIIEAENNNCFGGRFKLVAITWVP